ncbi:MAG: hypothetical protein ACREIF_12630 [Chthoniobacterales bacterium]
MIAFGHPGNYSEDSGVRRGNAQHLNPLAKAVGAMCAKLGKQKSCTRWPGNSRSVHLWSLSNKKTFATHNDSYEESFMQTINTPQHKHAGPNLGMLAIIYTLLFNAGLYFVISFTGGPHFPGPWESSETIATYFQGQPAAAVMCAFLQFGAAIPLGIFTGAAVSRLQFLGVRAAGAHIALFGGLMTAFNIAATALILWVMAYPGVAQDTAVLRALYYLAFAVGGVGFSVPMGILIAGICIPAAFLKALPKWLIVFGLVIAVIGELSWFDLITPKALPLIPLTRFPGFIWLIAAGFLLSRGRNSLTKENKQQEGQ